MLFRTDITGTRPLVPADTRTFVTTIGDIRQEAFERFANIELGKQMMAEVVSRFDDGTFLVKIADTAARMNLPEDLSGSGLANGPKVGDSIPMSLIAREPRPTFLLGQQPNSATATLSTAGQLIGKILEAAQQEGMPTSLIGKTALISSPLNIQSEPLAAALQHTVEYSGLFYEAHIVQWGNGSRTQAQLMQEPQARLANTMPGTPDDVSHPRIPGEALADAVKDAVLQVDTPDAADRTDAIDRISVATTHSGETQQVLDKAAAQMINLQLDTLENNRVIWQGELWPGQQMEWEISDETPSKQAGSPDAQERSWQSVLKLTFPNLGAVTATVLLTGDDVQVRLQSSSEAAVSLRMHGKELEAALSDAGTKLGYLSVNQNEPA